MATAVVTVTLEAGTIRVPLEGRLTPEGHAAFEVRGGIDVEIGILAPAGAVPELGLLIGASAVADA